CVSTSRYSLAFFRGEDTPAISDIVWPVMHILNMDNRAEHEQTSERGGLENEPSTSDESNT
ncbi:unnamed protein product, partial [Closterium sp. NIES-53]